MEKYIKNIVDISATYLQKLGLSQNWAENISEFSMLLMLLLVSYLAYHMTWKIVRRILLPIFQKSKNQFDDLLVKHKFFKRLSMLVPALILFTFSDESLGHFPMVTGIIITIVEVFFVVIIILVIDSVLSTINDYYNRFSFSKDHPIQAVIQIIKIITYILGILFIVGNFFEKDLSSLLISLGTLSAVMMLIFKDPILGFVGGLQLIFNKMVSIGDWISMPNFGADGTVLEINLTTVKVQNWDKTIVTIPTYSLISDSFQNWKGMELSGGRRIKRHINIDMDSVGFCSAEILEKYKKIHILSSYIVQKEKEINEYNTKNNVNPEVLVNGRRQTNLGVFQEYLRKYLAHRSDINKKMTFMVRQLQPNEKGIPIEIYIFTNTTDWIDYETIQADIFDHVLAVVPNLDCVSTNFQKVGKSQGL